MTDGAVVLCVNMGDTLHVVTDIIQVITVNSIYFHLKSFLVSRVTVNICFGSLFLAIMKENFYSLIILQNCLFTHPYMRLMDD